MKKKFYDVPTQVKFKESIEVVDDPCWLGGIAYEDYIICGCCGGIIQLEDVDEIKELNWIPISEEIMGE